MPELPEVETVARTLRPHVLHCRICRVDVLRASSWHELSLPPEALEGCCITAVDRRGKLLLLRLAAPEGPQVRDDRPTVLAVHLRMTGRLMTWPAQQKPGPHTRCIFDLETAQGEQRRLFFDDVRAFGLVLAGTEARLQRWDFWRELGPEPLELDSRTFTARLAQRGAALKAVLLDQKFVAGIGNIYADEALFRAGLDPRRRASSLSPAESAALLKALKAVLRLSIEQCGSSIRDYRDANGDVGAFQNSFAVYGRGGQACKKCGQPLVRLRVAGRATVCCPHCQQ